MKIHKEILWKMVKWIDNGRQGSPQAAADLLSHKADELLARAMEIEESQHEDDEK